MIDVTTHGADGHWDHADIKRLIEYRDALYSELGDWKAEAMDAEKERVRLCARIAALEAALGQCNEHRDSPHKIIGIVDAALAGMPPYKFASETKGNEHV